MYFPPRFRHVIDEKTPTSPGAIPLSTTPPPPRKPLLRPDLGVLRGLPRAEAMRIAMIKYGFDAATAARKIDAERNRSAQDG